MIDYTLLRKLATEPHVPAIHRAYGSIGTLALRGVMEFLTQLYQRVEPELIENPLIVYQRFQVSSPQSDDDSGRLFRSVEEVAFQSRAGATIELRGDGGFSVSPVTPDLANLSISALVYKISQGYECFIINGVDHRIENPNPLQASLFSRPTFSELRDALQRYARRIRVSGCVHFQATWDDPSRLFFKSGPEEMMRVSLHQYLSAVLRDVEVREEQNVDSSHPIDIKVTWQFIPRIALIEIKWLGKSRQEGRVTADHGPRRARSGARQLAQYLDANRTAAPEHQAQGYLVVFDGRRRGLNADTTSIDRQRGFYYETREISYHPRYHEQRADFAEPIRIFAEPLCDPN